MGFFFTCRFASGCIFAREIQHILVAGRFEAALTLVSAHKYFIVKTWYKLTVLSLNQKYFRSDVLLAGKVLYLKSMAIYSTKPFSLNVRIDSRILDISYVLKGTTQGKIALLQMRVKLRSAVVVPCQTVVLHL